MGPSLPASFRASRSAAKMTPKSSGAGRMSWRLRAGQKYSGEATIPDHRHRDRPAAGPQRPQLVAGREAEVVGHVLFDQDRAGSTRIEVTALLDLDPVDRRAARGRQPDDAAEQLGGADMQRNVGLGPGRDRLHPRRGARLPGDLRHVTAVDGQVGEPVLLVGLAVGGVEVAIGVVAGAEQGDAEEDRHDDRPELGSLAAQVPAQLRPQRPHRVTAPRWRRRMDGGPLTTRAVQPPAAPGCGRRRRSCRRASAAPGRPSARSRRCG